MYIVFEGPEGGGKSIHLRHLAKILQELGYVVVTTREPGGTPEGAVIRHLLLENRSIKLLGITEMFLFSASRAQQVRKVIRPALNAGKIVLSDRSYFSSFAYQGYGRKQSLTRLKKLTEIAMGRTIPNLVILLDVPVEIVIARKNDQGEITRLEEESFPFHERVRQGYLKMAEQDQLHWAVFDATKPIEMVREEILACVLARLQ